MRHASALPRAASSRLGPVRRVTATVFRSGRASPSTIAEERLPDSVPRPAGERREDRGDLADVVDGAGGDGDHRVGRLVVLRIEFDLVSPPVALTLHVVARILAEVGRTEDEDLEALRPAFVASPRAGRDAHHVPLLDLDDLVVELHPPAPAHDHVHLLLLIVRVAVREAIVGRDALIAQAALLELERLARVAELKVRRAVEVGPEILQILLEVPQRERHGRDPIVHQAGPFFGPPGTGKSHLAIALAIKACQAGHRVAFATAQQWIDRLEQAQHRSALDAELRRLERYSLLVVDEIGYLPLERQAANLLFALVARRYERGSIIVTSNRGFEAWGEILGDAMVAAALIDRLVHHAHIVTLKGKSYRLREEGHRRRAGGRDPARRPTADDLNHGRRPHPSCALFAS